MEVIVVAVGVVGGPFGGSAVAAGYVEGVAWGLGTDFEIGWSGRIGEGGEWEEGGVRSVM